MQTKTLVIDFDSTFMQVEGMEELSLISLRNHPEGAARQQQIKDITDLAMNGELSFQEALARRVALLNANRKDLAELVETLGGKVSESIVRNKSFFEKFADRIFIVSSGFREFIVPIVSRFGIKAENVYANTFTYDDAGNITGYDKSNELSGDKGKVILLQRLKFAGDVNVIGDGYTDYEIRAAGLANRFYAFTENVRREGVVSVADHVAASFDEFLYHNNLPMTVSYPKNRIHVLLLENIHPHAQEVFEAEGYTVEAISTALDEDELCEKIKNVSILGIRSKTQVTARVLEHANRLIAVGAFCIGTNQIDLKTCLRKGIAAFNAPYSNTRSVVELAVGEMIMLIRNIPDKSNKMHAGQWEKSAGNSHEIRGKKLGLVGYGNIGTQISVIAESLGMQVYYYDNVDKLGLGNARKCHSLHELLSLADVVSLHVDGRKENTDLIGAAEFEAMKDGVIFINLARGHVVNIPALTAALKSGKVHGAGVDVFPYEPKNNQEEFINELRGLPNVILTPHIGGSTEEAQHNIADFVPEKIIEYINTGNTFTSVNFPNLQLPEFKNAHRLLHIHENVSGILARINSVLAEGGINIVGQYLKTNDNIGYVITDIDKAYDKDIIQELKSIPNTIKFRVLY
ncbi:MAG: phosphoglycerate dehydrogenase [Bacteroidota bacterium]